MHTVVLKSLTANVLIFVTVEEDEKYISRLDTTF